MHQSDFELQRNAEIGLFVEQSMVFLSNSCIAPGVCHEPAVGAKFHHALMAPQHFLYFLPLPHGHGLFLPIFSDLTARVGFKAFSKSEISSGLSNSKPIIKCHPFFSHVSATYFALSSDLTRTVMGLFFDPSFAIENLPQLGFGRCASRAGRLGVPAWPYFETLVFLSQIRSFLFF